MSSTLQDCIFMYLFLVFKNANFAIEMIKI